VQNEVNLKLVASLNKGLSIAKGKYIARMDADDISLPERLTIQANFMEQHPNIAVCGTWMQMFGNVEPKILCFPEQPEIIKCFMLFTNCVVHPSVMLRRDILDGNFGYSDLYPHAEDYGLWVKVANKHGIANIPQALLKYRISADQIGARYKQQQWETVLKIQLEQIISFGIKPTQEESLLHLSISFGTILPGISLAQPLAQLTPEKYLSQLSYSGCTNASFAQAAFNWFGKLKEANARRHCYPEPAFTNVLRAYWASVCKNLSHAF
jgi:glycosyltransferase involved in cell wall biosynthesis